MKLHYRKSAVQKCAGVLKKSSGAESLLHMLNSEVVILPKRHSFVYQRVTHYKKQVFILPDEVLHPVFNALSLER